MTHIGAPAAISGTAANSYLSDVEFTTYAAGSLASSRLTASTSDTRERALRTAARMLNRLMFCGIATVPTQALQWPRYTVNNPDRWGYFFGQSEIPQRIKDAQAELALALLGEGESSPDGGLPGSALYTKAKVDVLEVEYRDSATASASDATGILRRYPAVWALVQPLTEYSGALHTVRA